MTVDEALAYEIKMNGPENARLGLNVTRVFTATGVLSLEVHRLREVIAGMEAQEVGGAMDCAKHEHDAVQAERAAVVAWIRKTAEEDCAGNMSRNLIGGWADAIEHGEHLE